MLSACTSARVYLRRMYLQRGHHRRVDVIRFRGLCIQDVYWIATAWDPEQCVCVGGGAFRPCLLPGLLGCFCEARLGLSLYFYIFRGGGGGGGAAEFGLLLCAYKTSHLHFQQSLVWPHYSILCGLGASMLAGSRPPRGQHATISSAQRQPRTLALRSLVLIVCTIGN
jgi:hypothetical protein